jgi:GNAT superfamily N-acetyltransferase
MAPWRVRDFHADDLDAAVRLWDNPAASGEAPAFSLSDLIAAVRSHEPAVVAVVGEELAGVAVAMVGGDRAWVMRISLAAAWRRRGIGSAMLGELERRLVAAGVHRIQCLLAGGSEIGALALEHAGYTARQGLVLYERLEPVDAGSAGALGRLGGRMVRAGAWDDLGGMAGEKELIERRVILPLAQPQLAERLGLVPPRAVVLFGPPGTGKTSFARAAASRLGWPFVELFPSRLAGESPAGLASALREAFALVAELDKVVLFIDEGEEIAGTRQPRAVCGAGGHQRDAQAHPAVPGAGRAAAHLRRELGPRPGQRVLAARQVRLRDPGGTARPGRAGGDLGPLPGRDPAWRAGHGRDRGGIAAVHPGRHRVRRAQDRAAGLRARPVPAR